MSLYRQLWVGVIALMLLIFCGSFAVNFYSAKSYLEQQLYIQSADNATALALSMSQQSKDEATSLLLVSALFDSGHFQQIRYTDVNGRILIDRINPNPPDRVPEWFARAIPIQVEAGTALVSDGWKQAGHVTVQAHTRFAYQSLWHGALTLLAWTAGAGLVAGLLASVLLNGLRRPLAQMVGQAHAITERRFITVAEPRVVELRSAVRAMNLMVERVKAMFNEQAERIKQLHDDANRDALTGLANRSFFLGSLMQELSDENAPPHGVLLIVRLHDLAGLNHRQGREKVDFFLQRCAAEFVDAAQEQNNGQAARLNGADFALMAPGIEIGQARTLAEALLGRIEQLYRRGHTDDSAPACCGFTLYLQGEKSADVLVRADTALLRAEEDASGIAASIGAAPNSQPNTNWQIQLRRALAENRFELAYFPVYTHDWQLLHHESAIRLREPDTGELIPAGRFMPYVLHLGLATEIDLMAIRLALQAIRSKPQAIAVNLSADSLRSETFRKQMLAELETASDASLLWLEVNEFGLRDEMAILADFAAQASRLGCKVGIEHFGRHFVSIPQLYELQLSYLKIDGRFIHNLDSQPGNQHLIRAISGIASGLGIMTIAEQVTTAAEWQTVIALGVDGGTGPGMIHPETPQ